MKRLRQRLFSNKGELLAETIVSMLILVILLALVTNVIQHALIMIGRSIQTGKDVQEQQVNPAILVEYRTSPQPPTTPTITFEIAGLVDITHIILVDDGGLPVAFSPD